MVPENAHFWAFESRIQDSESRIQDSKNSGISRVKGWFWHLCLPKDFGTKVAPHVDLMFVTESLSTALQGNNNGWSAHHGLSFVKDAAGFEHVWVSPGLPTILVHLCGWFSLHRYMPSLVYKAGVSHFCFCVSRMCITEFLRGCNGFGYSLRN